MEMNNNEGHEYQWIINEGLLRDEGTIYGIAGAGRDEKVAAIRDYFRIKKASLQTRQAQISKKLEEIGNKISAPARSPGDLSERKDVPNLIPVALQLCCYVGICFFNYWLERYWLSPVLSSTFICLGLYSFGLFSVFIGRSVMYNTAGSLTDERSGVVLREKWKIYFEEWGVPLVVALFVAILPRKAYPIEYTIIACIFFFMLFLFGGKGLVNTFFRARGEVGKYGRRRALTVLLADLEATVAGLEELNGEEEYKVKMFVSEYQLAFENSQLARGVTLKKLA